MSHLVAVAVRSDDVTDVLGLLWSTTHREMAVTDRDGALLAAVPTHEPCHPALLHTAPGPAAQAFALGDARHVAGRLTVLGPSLDARDAVLVDVATALMADQLRRSALAAGVLAERRAALKHRLVTDPHLSPDAMRTESARAELTLAGHYWPVIVRSEHDTLDAAALATADRVAQRFARAHLTVPYDRQSIVVLVAQDGPGGAHALEVQLLAHQVVAALRARGPAPAVHAITAKAGVGLGDVAAQVEALRRLARYVDRRHAPSARHVHLESGLALVALLESLDRRRAAAFVTAQIGPLLAHDAAHGSHLTDVLEAALDTPRRGDAARAAYMHRNTFRRRLNRAVQLVDGDLDDADERLAVHVALKLAGLLGVRG